MATKRIITSGNVLIFPDSIGMIDWSDLLANSTSAYTATKPCIAITAGKTTINNVVVHNNLTTATVYLKTGDKISGATMLNVFGIKYA